MRFVIDRIEDSTAVVELENGELIKVPAVLVEGASEGDEVVLSVNKQRTDTHSIFESLRKASTDDEE